MNLDFNKKCVCNYTCMHVCFVMCINLFLSRHFFYTTVLYKHNIYSTNSNLINNIINSTVCEDIYI